MAATAKVGDNRLGVERHAAVRDRHAIAPVFQEQPARAARRPRQSGTAWIESAGATDEAVSGVVRMAADDDVRARPREQLRELLIVGVWSDTGAVVRLWRRVNAEDLGSARKPQPQLPR